MGAAGFFILKIYFRFIIPFILLLLINRDPALLSYQRSQLVFGDIICTIQIHTSLTQKQAYLKISGGFEIIKKMNALFSFYKKESEINRINRADKPINHYTVSKELFRVLKLGIEFTKKTDHYFDLTFANDHSRVNAIKLEANNQLILSAAGVKINPTGFIKGHTVDLIAEYLLGNPQIISATIAIGGDIGHYSKRHLAKEIKIFDPRYTTSQASAQVTKPLMSVWLLNQSISTSGFYQRGAHIMNTKNSPIRHLQTTVISERGAVSDALSTAMLHMSLSKIKSTLKKFPRTRAVIVEQNHQIVEL